MVALLESLSQVMKVAIRHVEFAVGAEARHLDQAKDLEEKASQATRSLGYARCAVTDSNSHVAFGHIRKGSHANFMCNEKALRKIRAPGLRAC